MILKAINLSQRYGSFEAVRQINLSIQKGSLTALLGPNGAGKSTTMRMLTGLDQAAGGEVVYAEKTKIGVVFQNSVLDGELTVHENLAIRAAQYKGVPTDRIEILIHDLGLTSFADQRYGTLSGGQKRRVDIARALLNKPDILFLDEPTTGLDIQTRRAIWHLLADLQKKDQLTIVLTTHYLDETDQADQVYIIDHGQVIASGSSKEIKHQYAPSQLRLEVHADGPERLLSQGYDFESNQGEGQLLIRGLTASEVIALLSQNKDVVTDFEYLQGTMDDAFIALTGQEVR
ncbi:MULTISPECIES: ABC transporter ATP-binding protein [Fructobacillus]|jgi:multidrug/hemolysin transport system ATP-binding protein|uniref:ATPase component (CcmA) n=1 Tax=Fructobacillus cardui TaxID=2893170 RepID=A0ABM9MWC1_9LACO|nr:ABC transporter ATP-binding protein [Fructobacillus sp. EFB-N1]KMK53365.1 Daunorubicin/doxorubicin resistance ATP-binding protein DrrA [Fructobacillus sp. EFB-N1]CAK1242431.1 ABC-type multidrug transport system [Fructobacillus cardui]CAK1244680.1 ABC-type multidrug transport system [Fructobacillus cardui]CAK1244915.1 ABC-type multidrug transport system [Fructobacillus cardui]